MKLRSKKNSPKQWAFQMLLILDLIFHICMLFQTRRFFQTATAQIVAVRQKIRNKDAARCITYTVNAEFQEANPSSQKTQKSKSYAFQLLSQNLSSAISSQT